MPYLSDFYISSPGALTLPVSMYNRALSAAGINQNFQVTRKCFGI